jgi:hypothetical protein
VTRDPNANRITVDPATSTQLPQPITGTLIPARASAGTQP